MTTNHLVKNVRKILFKTSIEITLEAQNIVDRSLWLSLGVYTIHLLPTHKGNDFFGKDFKNVCSNFPVYLKFSKK